MKIFILSCLLITVTVFAASQKRVVLETPSPSPSPTIAPTATPVVVATPNPEASPTAVTPKDNVQFYCKDKASCTDEERALLPKVQKKLNEVMQSQCFADHLILEKYRSKLVQTNGLTREEVVKKLQTGKVSIPVKFYLDEDSGVYGYTYPNDPTIYLNRYYRTKEDYKNGDWGLCAEVSNEAHEAAHKAPMGGFDHDFNATKQRPFSVPYSVNFAVDSCCKD